MNILIVDGNEREASNNYTEIGMLTQFEVYKNLLQKLSDNNLNITTIHPACMSNYMPKGISLDDFHGIIWTGSLLNIYDFKQSIERQIELAKELLTKTNKIFGSCWGLQVLATAAGGKIRKNPSGLEAVIAKNITLNKKGIYHPMYRDKPLKFDSFCWHYDEVEQLPSNCSVLSSNNYSSVQSFSFVNNNSEVWAVQYHPEFDPEWISGLMKQRESILLKEGVYKNKEDFNEIFLPLSNFKKSKNEKNNFSISNTLLNFEIHTIELSNWLKNISINI